MPDPDAPFAHLSPGEDDERPARQPMGSPYAIPLSALVAGAAISLHDQVITQPEPNTQITASGGGLDPDGD